MTRYSLLLLLLPFLFMSCQKAGDKLEIPKIFSDHMVLQRGQENPLWGWTQPNARVEVTLSGQGGEDVFQAKGNEEGRWQTNIAAQEAGGPYKLILRSGEKADTLQDIWFGEVWLCGGQSNMEFTLEMLEKYEDIKNSTNPKIRFFNVPRRIAFSPKSDLEDGEWQLCDPSTTGDLSAVAYFFAKNLLAELDVPIGLISSNWGGTVVETWISETSARKVAYYKEALDKIGGIDVAELQAQAREDFVNKYLKAGGIPLEKDTIIWSKASYDDSQWPLMRVPELWENQGLRGMNGVVWFRKEFNLASAPKGEEVLLSLGKIDDDDQTFLNGVLVGSMKQVYNSLRKYPIEAGLLKEGKNTLAVRVNDTGGGGGFWGHPAEMYLAVGEEKIPLSGEWKYRVSLNDLSLDVPGLGPNGNPTLLYNGMIHPIEKYGIKGAIWYQGESNEGRGEEYQTLFPLLIEDWRERWEQDFSFYFVQLANFNASNPEEAPWAEIREAQTMTLRLPKTGMAVTTDIGNPDDIHPKNKEDVGKRLALWALSKDYGREGLVYSGPLYEEAEINGDHILIDFNHTGSGLAIGKGDSELKGFEIAGADKQFYPANAVIQGKQLRVSSPKVPIPAAVRYAWSNNPEEANLFNKEGLPASSFRTDNWPLNSEGKIKDYKVPE